MPHAHRPPAPRLETRETDRKFAYLMAHWIPSDATVAGLSIKRTESGLIREDKGLAILLDLDPPSFTRIRQCETGMPGKAAARLLKAYGLDNVPECIDSTLPEHQHFRDLLMAPMEEFLDRLTWMGADIPGARPETGARWQALLQRDAAPADGGGYVRVFDFDSPAKPMRAPSRALPIGVADPIRLARLPEYTAGHRIAYVVGVDGLLPHHHGPIHLWAVHRATAQGRPMHIPLLPAPWTGDGDQWPLSSERELAMTIPHRATKDRCLVVSGNWGAEIEVVVFVTARPMDADVLEACRRLHALEPEMLDRVAVRLKDPQRWARRDWALLRTRYRVLTPVVQSGGEAEAQA